MNPRAKAEAPTHVALLRTEFRNSVSAHIALHALESVDDADKRAQHQTAYAALMSSLNAIFRASKVFDDVAGSATNLQLTMNSPFSSSSKSGLFKMMLSDLVYRRCHVFLFALRMMHRVAAAPADLNELARRLEVGTKGIIPLMAYRHTSGSALARQWPN